MLVPCALFFLNGKSAEDYKRCWEIIKRLCPNFKPREFHSDMETSLWKSFEETFGAKAKFCYFHVLQAWLRKLQTLKLKPLVKKKEKLNTYWLIVKGCGYTGLSKEMVPHVIAILDKELQSLRRTLR